MILKHKGGVKGCVAIVIALWLAPAHAQSSVEAAGRQPWPENAALLVMMQRAAHQLNYRGVFAYQHGHTMQSSRIIHTFDGKDERERLEQLDGKPRESLRLNNEVRELIPEAQIIRHQRRQGDLFPGLLLSDPGAIDHHYRIQVRPDLNRVAGRACRVVDIIPKDDYRFGYRLCADDETGLLLRARTVSDEARLIEQISFAQLTINPHITDKDLEPSWPIDTWRTIEPNEKPVDLFALGWRIPAPPGFVSTLQVSRVFAGDRLVNQLILSDGLATITIFIEPYHEERSDYKPHGPARNGSVNLYGVQVGHFWLTVLGEVPARAVEQIATSIKYQPE